MLSYTVSTEGISPEISLFFVLFQFPCLHKNFFLPIIYFSRFVNINFLFSNLHNFKKGKLFAFPISRVIHFALWHFTASLLLLLVFCEKHLVASAFDVRNKWISPHKLRMQFHAQLKWKCTFLTELRKISLL